MTVEDAIESAEAILPGESAPVGEEDPRWQAIIAVGELIETDPLPIWEFVSKWGGHDDDDLRAAIATCLTEHLLQHHFDLIFPMVEARVDGDDRFRESVRQCAKFGQAALTENARRLDSLIDPQNM